MGVDFQTKFRFTLGPHLGMNESCCALAYQCAHINVAVSFFLTNIFSHEIRCSLTWPWHLSHWSAAIDRPLTEPKAGITYMLHVTMTE